MPKDRRVSSFSSHQSRSSSYPCSSKNSDQDSFKNLLQSVGDKMEWEEVRCPICMEHPHNAVLLLCSSHEKGCHPYMCDTSHRHSNCLDQFRKSSGTTTANPLGADETEEQRRHTSRIAQGRQLQQKLSCPLCRGQIGGWTVIKAAREFMNAKPRSCSLETCNFSGTYSELRNHARLEHPSVRPSDADPMRQNDWARMEREIDFQDFLSAAPLESGEELGDWMNLVGDFDGIFDFESVSEGEWDDNLHMDIEVELPFTLFETYFPLFPFFDPSLSDSPENSDQSNSRGTTPRTRALNQPRRPRPNNRGEDSDLLWRSRSNRGQRQTNQRRRRREYR